MRRCLGGIGRVEEQPDEQRTLAEFPVNVNGDARSPRKLLSEIARFDQVALRVAVVQRLNDVVGAVVEDHEVTRRELDRFQPV